jgi:UDP-glucose 4-epimerase
MRVLVTGSSGYLGSALIPRLRAEGHLAIGLDPVPGPATDVVGTVTDRELVRITLRRNEITAIVHAGALHKPHVATHPASDFVSINVQGTLNLLEEAVATGGMVDRFVFTSTTSLMISRELHRARTEGRGRATWITEAMAPLEPRNIYGVTKLAAEHLCRMVHQAHGLPVVVLRTSRFFPEEDDMAHAIVQSEPNTKANEYLFRRLHRDDATESHRLALARAPELGFDTFIVSSRTPFQESDCTELMTDAPRVVERLFPRYRELYERRGWTMFQSIDRVYDCGRAERVLGYRPRHGFAEVLESLAG